MASQRYNRRDFLRLGGGMLAAGAAAGSMASLLSGCKSQGGAAGGKVAQGTFNWLTWSDHYLPDQVAQVSKDYKINANPNLFSDNSEALLKVQQVGGKQIDMVSGDALWVAEFYKNGLIEPFDIEGLDSAKGLFPEAKKFTFWQSDKGYLAFPFGWSPSLIAYNPKYVTPAPDSWQVLWDPKYKGRIALELQPFDIMADIARALGFKEPYNMTPDEIQQAKAQLVLLVPNLLKFVEQNVETVRLLADESIWLCTANLGIEDRVKDAGGPEIKSFVPKEGTVGFIDGEMIVTGAVNRDVAFSYLNVAETAEWLGKNFLEYGRPLLHKGAYEWLVKNGYEERAKRYLFDRIDVALGMKLKGPAQAMDLYIQAFNEAIG